MKRKKPIIIALYALLIVVGIACYDLWAVSALSKQIPRPEGWTDKTHGNKVAPDYEVVFPQNKINQIKIRIPRSDNWDAMQANMRDLFGMRGRGQRDRRLGPGGIRPDARVRPEFGGPDPGKTPQRNSMGPDPGIPGWVDMSPENPIWIPATIEFNGITWTNVGVRYKGGSSLTSRWRRGSLKMPLKLDFDEFEAKYPEINNQRFYGFRQLSLSNAFGDHTFMREAIAWDVFEEAGLASAETAYYQLILDYGEGPVDLGLYIMTEVIDDTIIKRFFGDDSGNIYEGDGPGASLALGSFNRIKSSFVKQNNIQEADWSDIEALYNALHSEKRASDPDAWRESLESIFNVNVFLEWLAITAIIQHWDTYGSMPHNFYLYHDQKTGLLKWISWDHNLVLGANNGRGIRGTKGVSRGRIRGNLSIGRDEAGQDWPLIRYVLDDPVYNDRYKKYIDETVKGAFNPDKIVKKCRRSAKMIAPYTEKDVGKKASESALQDLINSIHERFNAAIAFLASGK